MHDATLYSAIEDAHREINDLARAGRAINARFADHDPLVLVVSASTRDLADLMGCDVDDLDANSSIYDLLNPVPYGVRFVVRDDTHTNTTQTFRVEFERDW